MLFNSLPFVVFFFAVLTIHRACPPERRRVFLLGCSLIFYFMWLPVYLVLLMADVAANYALLRWLVRSAHPKRVLALACVLNLSLLGFFKYAAFLVAAVAPALGSLFHVSPEIPSILLPLGISFYTFQILALTIDAYRGRIERLPRFGEYALFVSFFPQLIAGPILRHPFVEQLRTGGTPNADWTRRGVWLLALGFFKKVVLADFLLAPYVDRVFGMPDAASAAEHLLAIYSFAFQMYCDFSGYSDIARGLARLLGFELPLNFREPYLSRNPAEFWRRWHITLSQWLRDYLYVPLGGNRRGSSRVQINLMLTMLLGGLWHGAAWTFVLWGGLHGLLLVAHRRSRGTPPRDGERVSLRDLPAILACFHAVCALWVFFRAPDLDAALAMFGALAQGSWLEGWSPVQIGVLLFCAGLHPAERFARLHHASLRIRLDGRIGGLVEGLALGTLVALALVLGAAAGGEFIYFQF